MFSVLNFRWLVIFDAGIGTVWKEASPAAVDAQNFLAQSGAARELRPGVRERVKKR